MNAVHIGDMCVCLFTSAPMSQNAGDYVFTAGGLDNVITNVCTLMLYWIL